MRKPTWPPPEGACARCAVGDHQLGPERPPVRVPLAERPPGWKSITFIRRDCVCTTCLYRCQEYQLMIRAIVLTDLSHTARSSSLLEPDDSATEEFTMPIWPPTRTGRPTLGLMSRVLEGLYAQVDTVPFSKPS